MTRGRGEGGSAIEASRNSGACFRPREKRILGALAACAIPPGKLLTWTVAEAEVVEKIDLYMAQAPREISLGFRILLWFFELAAILRYLRPFVSLSSEQQLCYINGWHDSRFFLRRIMLRTILMTCLMAYYSDERVNHALGIQLPTATSAPERPPERPGKVIDARDLDEGRLLVEADVCVVGTGAGGAPLGKELAERGHKVVFLEEGGRFDRPDFGGRLPFQMMQVLYRERGMTLAAGKPGIPLPLGQCVGGTTTVNSGTCFRVPEQTLARWRDELGLPFTAESLDPHYRRVEEIIHVEEASWEVLGKAAELIKRGADALGYSSRPLKRNARRCRGSGICCFGCPTDAKQSMNISYIPLALDASAEVYTHVRVEEILTEGGRAIGVRGRVVNGSDTGRADGGGGHPGRMVEVRARVISISCGALLSPVLLRRNHLCRRNGHLGKHLTIHPGTKVLAEFEEEVRGWESIPQGYCVDHFAAEGIMMEGASLPPDMGSVSFNFYGPSLKEVMERYHRLVSFGLMVSDTGEGFVRPLSGNRPFIYYTPNHDDLLNLRRGIAELCRIYFAAGAKALYPPLAGIERVLPSEGVEVIETYPIGAGKVELAAFHPLGTCRMGASPRDSVVDLNLETHEVENLFIVDGSVFPTSLGVNPQLTIMAYADRAAGYIDERLSAASGRKRSAVSFQLAEC